MIMNKTLWLPLMLDLYFSVELTGDIKNEDANMELSSEMSKNEDDLSYIRNILSCLER